MLLVGEFRAGLDDTDPMDAIEHTEPIEDGTIHRQEGLADMKARMMRLLQELDLPALGDEKARNGRTRRPAANHQHITGFNSA